MFCMLLLYLQMVAFAEILDVFRVVVYELVHQLHALNASLTERHSFVLTKFCNSSVYSLTVPVYSLSYR